MCKLPQLQVSLSLFVTILPAIFETTSVQPHLFLGRLSSKTTKACVYVKARKNVVSALTRFTCFIMLPRSFLFQDLTFLLVRILSRLNIVAIILAPMIDLGEIYLEEIEKSQERVLCDDNKLDDFHAKLVENKVSQNCNVPQSLSYDNFCTLIKSHCKHSFYTNI